MMKNIQRILTVCGLWAVVLMLQTSQVHAQIQIQAAEDAFTRTGSKGDTNYGSADYMQSASGEGSNLHEIFLKYDLSQDIPDLDLVKSATLTLTPFGSKWGEDGSTQWVSYIQDDTWAEATITGNTRPATSQDSVAAVVTTSSGGATLETPHTIDITDLVKAETDNTLSLKLSTSLLGSTFKAEYHSKEHESGGTYIEVELYTPGVAFSASKQSLKAGGSVTFTDESTYSPTEWKWTFEGGSPAESTDQNPTVTYSAEGKYDVTLEATNAGGTSTATKSGYIVVDAEGVTTVRVYATEDAFTRTGSRGDTNYGDRDYMQSAQGEGSNLHEIFLKYDLSQEVSDLEIVKSATLYLTPFGTKWGEDGSTQWVSYIQDDTWQEGTITGNTRPAVLDSLSGVVTTSSGGETLETPHAIDLTDAVKAETDKTLSLHLSTTLQGSTFKAEYHSREHSSGGTYIEIVIEQEEEETLTTELEAVADLNIYPNPTFDRVTINNAERQIEKLMLFDLTGKVVKEQLVEFDSDQISMSLVGLQSGNYLIKVYSLDGTFKTGRIIKQ
ncbi:MAG: DNRLRE domain-containing protein [Cyclobacteriaceae bacterium]